MDILNLLFLYQVICNRYYALVSLVAWHQYLIFLWSHVTNNIPSNYPENIAD